MILSGEKKQEYREIKPYWNKRLLNRNYDIIRFRHGYSKNAPEFDIEYLGCKIDYPKAEWSNNWKGKCYVLQLGNILNVNKSRSGSEGK